VSDYFTASPEQGFFSQIANRVRGAVPSYFSQADVSGAIAQSPFTALPMLFFQGQDALRQDAKTIGKGVKKGIDALGRAQDATYAEGYANPDVYRPVTDATLGLIGGGVFPAVGKMARGMKVSDPSTLRIFAGEGAKTADKTALKKAKTMTKAGKSRDDIWQETGWFKDKDDWKFEIPDDAVRLKRTTEATQEKAKTSDILDHPNLFSAYPSPSKTYKQLKDEHAKVLRKIAYYQTTKDNDGKQGYERFTPEMAQELPLLKKRSEELGRLRRSYIQGIGDIPTSGGFSTSAYGSYNPEIDAIYNYVDPVRRPIQYKSTQLHELQHAIQDREGFARGGNPASVSNKVINPQWQKWHSNQDVVQEIKSIKESPAYRKEQQELESVWKTEYAPKLERLEALELKGKNAQEREAYYPLIDEIFAEFDAYRSGRQPLYNKLVELSKTHGINANNLREPNKFIDPDEAYRRLAGEAEARNVQTRMDFTPAERKAKAPWTTLDVPEEQLYYRKTY
jgi:hypothetical protein